ncbi:MAG: carboxylesterase family protein [Bacteroidales bacterium]|nr:carboxylesterase family protein [Bacteroidales bacterium]
MKTKIFSLLLALFIASSIYCQDVATFLFAEKDGEKLYMDIYQPEKMSSDSICVMFIFGGGFISGARNESTHIEYYNMLTEHGYVVAAIDYRLGLKGVTKLGPLNHKPLEKAISMAVEDVYSATNYLINNSKVLNINPKNIVLCGSSAGAITALQADYILANKLESSEMLPESFKYGGIISFSGAILSKQGKVKWREQAPAPTLMFHGTADKLVTYKQIKIFRLGFFGADPLSKRFNKYDYPYYVYRFEDNGHEIAMQMKNKIDETVWFINNYVVKQKDLQIDLLINDPDIKKPQYGSHGPKDLYNKDNK